MRVRFFKRLSAALAIALAACTPCLEEGRNGVPDPGENEYQLVFSNIVSRETTLFVDGKEVAVVCEETEYATVGNYAVNTHSTIKMRSEISGSDCYDSPNCSSNCGSQSCPNGAPVIDTTPFAGRVYSTGLIWRQ